MTTAAPAAATAPAAPAAAAAVAATAEGVRDLTRRYLASSLGRPVADDLDVFAAGFANSLFAAQLVMFVEETFALTVEDDELELANFASVDAVTGYVRVKTGMPEGS